jgi:hypothetical protein
LISKSARILANHTFRGRGKGDYANSHDLEDLLTVIDGREAIVQEIADTPTLRIENYFESCCTRGADLPLPAPVGQTDSRGLQKLSFNPNWICRDVVTVLRIAPAL